jgi:hypothetical protein
MAAPKNKILSALILLVLASAYYYLEHKAPENKQLEDKHSENQTNPTKTTETPSTSNHQTALDYFNRRVSGKMITLNAEVINILSDDNHPPRHQRFIIKLDNKLTVLISHNIDLAPRVKGLNAGDLVTITGQYEWNDKGGVIHWTHHDPQGRRDGGQIVHNGTVYR